MACRRCCRKPRGAGQQPQRRAAQMLVEGLKGTDARVARGEPVSPAFLFALLLWPGYCRELMQLQGRACTRPRPSAAPPTASPCSSPRGSALPRRFSLPMQEIWLLQSRMRQRKRSHAGAPALPRRLRFHQLRQSAPERTPRTSPSGARRRRAAAKPGRMPISPTRPPTGDDDTDAARAVDVGVAGAAAASQGDRTASLRRARRQPRRCRRSALRALARMDALPGTQLLRASRRYRTPAWKPRQPISSTRWRCSKRGCRAATLLGRLFEIERAHGRDRASETWGPRTLDLDLLLLRRRGPTNPVCACRIRTCTSARSRCARCWKSRRGFRSRARPRAIAGGDGCRRHRRR